MGFLHRHFTSQRPLFPGRSLKIYFFALPLFLLVLEMPSSSPYHLLSNGDIVPGILLIFITGGFLLTAANLLWNSELLCTCLIWPDNFAVVTLPIYKARDWHYHHIITINIMSSSSLLSSLMPFLLFFISIVPVSSSYCISLTVIIIKVINVLIIFIIIIIIFCFVLLLLLFIRINNNVTYYQFQLLKKSRKNKLKSRFEAERGPP